MHVRCYCPRAMLSTAADTFRAWLRARRGDTSQEDLAADITAVIKWHIARDRYSKYESGGTPIGPIVRKHFIDYWAKKGGQTFDEFAREADREHSEPPPSDIAQLAAAIRQQNDAINALAGQVKALVEREPGEVAAAVALAVRDTLRAAGIGEPLPQA